MDYSSYKLAACQTIPHAGLHMISHLINLHPAMTMVGISVNGIEGLSDSACEKEVDEFLSGKIDEEILKQELLVSLNNRHLLKINPNASKKYLFIVSHVKAHFIENNPAKICVQDVVDKINLLQIIPLRDPLLVVCTGLILGGKHSDATERDLRITRMGFNFVLNTKLNTFFLPIDLLATQSVDQRVETIRKLCEDFLGIATSDNYKDITNSWTKRHPTDITNPIYWNGSIPESILKCKEMLLRGENPWGIHPIVDRELEYYKNLSSLKKLFKSIGYENLAWF